MLFCTFQFLVVLVIAPRYGILAGWIRRQRMVPQQLVEDILGSIQRNQGQPVSMGTLAGYVKGAPKGLPSALRSMTREGLLRWEGDEITLTPQGTKEANRILRAHRLWETYLRHVGAPENELHGRAHELEHVHDPASVAYLDDLLGHPIHDPHGKVIPQDAAASPGEVSRLSFLRESASGIVESVGDQALGLGLTTGETIRIGPREDNQQIWVVWRADGTEVRLDHRAADAIAVRILPN